jgi:sulfotransferase
MKKTFYFLSGLPRSGSTVLAAILSQNPDIFVSASSPLVGLIHGAKVMWDTSEHVKAYATPGQIESVMAGIIEGFYAHESKPIIIDKNRAWPNPENQSRLRDALGHEPKIIATVRPIPEILTSFISLIKKNHDKISFIDEELIRLKLPLSDENRCGLLMNEGGHVYQSWEVLKTGFEKHRENIHIVEYNELIRTPEKIVADIYDFLGEPRYLHNFSHIINPVVENDEKAYNIPGMHTIRSELRKTSSDPREIIGETIFQKAQGGEFWKER